MQVTAVRGAWVSALLVAMTVTLGAQVPSTVSPGTRIRLTRAVGGKVTGQYAARLGDTVEIRFAGHQAVAAERIALADVRRVEVSRGRVHPVGKSTLWGAAIGTGAGALIGLAIGPCPQDADFGEAYACTFYTGQRETLGQTMLLWAGIGLLWGSLTGVVVGAIGHEAWAPATIAGWRPEAKASSTEIRVGWQIPIGHRSDAMTRLRPAP